MLLKAMCPREGGFGSPPFPELLRDCWESDQWEVTESWRLEQLVLLPHKSDVRFPLQLFWFYWWLTFLVTNERVRIVVNGSAGHGSPCLWDPVQASLWITRLGSPLLTHSSLTSSPSCQWSIRPAFINMSLAIGSFLSFGALLIKKCVFIPPVFPNCCFICLDCPPPRPLCSFSALSLIQASCAWEGCFAPPLRAGLGLWYTAAACSPFALTLKLTGTRDGESALWARSWQYRVSVMCLEIFFSCMEFVQWFA